MKKKSIKQLNAITECVSPGEDVGLRGVGGGGREGRGGLDPLDDAEGESMPFTRPLGAGGCS